MWLKINWASCVPRIVRLSALIVALERWVICKARSIWRLFLLFVLRMISVKALLLQELHQWSAVALFVHVKHHRRTTIAECVCVSMRFSLVVVRMCLLPLSSSSSSLISWLHVAVVFSTHHLIKHRQINWNSIDIFQTMRSKIVLCSSRRQASAVECAPHCWVIPRMSIFPLREWEREKNNAFTQDRTTDLQFTRLALYHWAIKAWCSLFAFVMRIFPADKNEQYSRLILRRGRGCAETRLKSTRLDLNPSLFRQTHISFRLMMKWNDVRLLSLPTLKMSHQMSSVIDRFYCSPFSVCVCQVINMKESNLPVDDLLNPSIFCGQLKWSTVSIITALFILVCQFHDWLTPSLSQPSLISIVYATSGLDTSIHVTTFISFDSVDGRNGLVSSACRYGRDLRHRWISLSKRASARWNRRQQWFISVEFNWSIIFERHWFIFCLCQGERWLLFIWSWSNSIGNQSETFEISRSTQKTGILFLLIIIRLTVSVSHFQRSIFRVRGDLLAYPLHFRAFSQAKFDSRNRQVTLVKRFLSLSSLMSRKQWDWHERKEQSFNDVSLSSFINKWSSVIGRTSPSAYSLISLSLRIQWSVSIPYSIARKIPSREDSQWRRTLKIHF